MTFTLALSNNFMTATPSYCSCSRSCSERNVWTVNQARGTGRERTRRGKDLVCRGEPGWERRWPTSLPTAQPPGSSGKAQAGRPSFPGRLEGRRQVARMKIHKTRQEKAACSAVTHIQTLCFTITCLRWVGVLVNLEKVKDANPR